MPAFTVPSTLPEWAQTHMRRYLDTNGDDGHLWDASIRGGSGLVPTLLLATRQRKSGGYLTLPLIYGQTSTGYVIVASKGGAPRHPAWYHNLISDPNVQVQIKADRFAATAQTVVGEQRQELWEKMVTLYAPYAAYQTKATREIPVIVLERTV